MSDWGAVHSTVLSALAGLDQELGEQLDTENFLAEPLERAIEDGSVPQARLDDMVGRILTAIFASGVYDDPPKPGPRATEADAATAQAIAEAGIVLLKNDRILPLPRNIGRIAIIGAHADRRRAVRRRLVPGGSDRRHRGHRSGAERLPGRAGVRSVFAPRRYPAAGPGRVGHLRRRRRPRGSRA